MLRSLILWHQALMPIIYFLTIMSHLIVLDLKKCKYSVWSKFELYSFLMKKVIV